MADNKFLTAEEVSERYRGEITVGTLRNWRAMRIGPAFVKIGKAVLYPVRELAVIMHHAERFLHGWPMAARQQSVRLDRCRSLALRHVWC